MASYDLGKHEICAWIRANFPNTCTVLDVGACDGKWQRLLSEYRAMDAVEIFKPNAERLTGYREVFNIDVSKLRYGWYDLVIFGDVIEHMEVKTAQKALTYAKKHSRCVIVGVPFLYPQGELYGNQYERHIQDDLTKELFEERYKGFTILLSDFGKYCYYVWRQE